MNLLWLIIISPLAIIGAIIGLFIGYVLWCAICAYLLLFYDMIIQKKNGTYVKKDIPAFHLSYIKSVIRTMIKHLRYEFSANTGRTHGTN